jgi:hypothetical protein
MKIKLYKYDADVYDEKDKDDNDCFHGYVIAKDINEATLKVGKYYKKDGWIMADITLWSVEVIK